MKGYKKADKREPKYEKCLLTVGLKPFRLKGKGKASAGKKFRILQCEERNCWQRRSYKI